MNVQGLFLLVQEMNEPDFINKCRALF